MAKGMTIQVGARVPLSIIEFMDDDVNNNNFQNRSDWIVCACREFVKIRQKELSGDGLGGGASIKVKGWPTAIRFSKKISAQFGSLTLILLELLDRSLGIVGPSLVSGDFLPMSILQ